MHLQATLGCPCRDGSRPACSIPVEQARARLEADGMYAVEAQQSSLAGATDLHCEVTHQRGRRLKASGSCVSAYGP